MKKIKLLILFISTFGLVAIGSEEQTEEKATDGVWKTKGSFAINASQTTFSNWAAGGMNSVAGNSFFNYTANFKRNKMSWDNSVDLGIGYIKQGDEKFFKNDDRIVLSSKYGRYAFEHFYYSGLLSFRSQFTDGYKSITDDTRVSSFLAPAYITVSIGMDYKPNDNFSLLISPLAGRTTIVRDSLLSAAGAFGVTPGKNVRYEFGGVMKIDFKWDIMENISYRTTMELFSNYLEKPQNIDVNWDNVLNMKINSYFSANIRSTLIYDDDIKIQYDPDNPDKKGPRLQMRNIFGIGLTFNF